MNTNGFQKDHLVDLMKGLQHFGLNPEDWKIKRARSQMYKVQSKKDPNFIFTGAIETRGQRLKWTFLELASL